MAEYISLPSCIELHMWRSPHKERGFTLQNSRFRIAERRFSCESCKLAMITTWKRSKLSGPCFRETFMKCAFMEYGEAASDWVPVADKVLLMASIFLTYMAGVIPVQKSHQRGKNVSNDSAASKIPTFSGSATKDEDKFNSKDALDAVKRKLLDSLDSFQCGNNLGNKVLQIEENSAKRPLSLSAIAECPRLRLLWSSFEQIEEEVNNMSNAENIDADGLFKGFSELIRKSVQPLCQAWLKRELCLETSDSDKAIVSMIFEKLREDDNVLMNIRKSGKEGLYADLLHFLSFGSVREGCYYDQSMFVMHGTSILEDLVITIADGIASMYLELISVDGSFSNEINSLGFALCTLSTRALQKLRNEVAMNQWLYQNLEAVVSMYEDRFDLCTLESRLIEAQGNRQIATHNWWTRLTRRNSKTVAYSLTYIVISCFSMPIKRTQELRALTGWRYYFSLLIELSDIATPLVRAVIDKISSAISFFLVCLIGRSLGLIYTGIRQSLQWK